MKMYLVMLRATNKPCYVPYRQPLDRSVKTLFKSRYVAEWNMNWVLKNHSKEYENAYIKEVEV